MGFEDNNSLTSFFPVIYTKKEGVRKKTPSFFVYSLIHLCVRECQPLHIAEVLTMRQVGILRVHTYSTLEVAGNIW